MSEHVQRSMPASMPVNGPQSSAPVGTVLVVDDELELRRILVEALPVQGYEVSGCASGNQALDELQRKNFDILLTDLMMPEMDGISLLQAALEIDPHLVCIIMTGQGSIQTAIDAMKLGAFDYVLKPFRMQTLMPVLTRAINTRHLRLENLQLRETVAIHGLCQTIAFTLDPQTVLSKLADAALQQSDADEVSILLPTTDGAELYVAAVRGEKRERLLGERIPFDQSIASWVARERTPVILNGPVNDERFVALWPRPDIKSSISVPMQVASKLVGVINLNMINRPRPFTLGQMKALTILASTAAAALESSTLYRQMRRAEEKYRSIFDNAIEGIFQATPEGRFITVNPSLARILGYDSPEEMIETVTDASRQFYVDPDSQAEAARIENEWGVLRGFEFQVYRKDGTKIWLSGNRRSARNEAGVELYREGSVENITERKRVEQIQARRAVHALFRAEVSASLAASREPLQVTLQSCVTAMVQHLGAAFARIWTLNREEEVLELQASAGIYTHTNGPHARVPVGSFKIGKIAQERAPHITNEVQTDPRVSDKEWARREGMVAFAGYPLLAGTRVLGVMAMFSRANLAEDTLDALASVADLISQGIERKHAEEALRESEARKRAILESSMDCIITMNHEGLVVDWNPAAEKTFGYSQKEAIGQSMAELIIPERYREQHNQGLKRYLGTGKAKVLGQRLELSAELKNGSEIPVELTITRIESKGAAMFTGYLRDITARKKAENRLSAQYTVTRALAESNAIDEGASRILQAICESLGWEYGSLWTVDRRANVLRCSEVWQSLGVEADEFESTSRRAVFAQGVGLPGRVWNESEPTWIADVVEDINFPRSSSAAKVGLHGACAFPIRFRSEILGVVEFFSRTIRESDTDLLEMMVTIGSQIGQFIQRKRVEEALGESEEQLRQSQKLEAVGQLAGGVAHDFNNLLTVISGYSDLLLRKLPADGPLRAHASEIKKAGDRASGLTRQLLAFSRKQILQPKVLDLNTVVSDLDKMLRRLIGEDVDLLTITEPELGQVKADPGQIEQVVVNLVVNARDAMATGGKVTIETANAQMTADYVQQHAQCVPGAYVMLAVSDSGSGIDPAIRDRIFEPFFSTKGAGKGTGLGLSTVYGIVKQSGGHIWVYSEADKGTTFKIYLPRVDEGLKERTDSEQITAVSGGNETILLVEDEGQVRQIAQQILESLGYRVITAENGEQALTIASAYADGIDLMITDVVMPQMGGRELAERLSPLRRNLRIVFMSGYTDDAIVRHGLMDDRLVFIQKPFTADALARKVRMTLDAEQ